MFILVVTVCGHFLFSGYECRVAGTINFETEEACQTMAAKSTYSNLNGQNYVAECRKKTK